LAILQKSSDNYFTREILTGEQMQYTVIPTEAMDEFLRALGFVPSVVIGKFTKEFVYDYTIVNLPENIIVRVFTSIHKENGCRDKGRDAIRICSVNLTRNCGWIKSVRVLRVQGWKNNLARAIDRVLHQATRRITPRAPAPIQMEMVVPF
jgi:hypothetical protein